MIYVTQGHEKSIALEVFLKSYSVLDTHQQRAFTLVTNKAVLRNNLLALNIPHTFAENSVDYFNVHLTCSFIETSFKDYSYTLLSTLAAIDLMDFKRDILITLPSSKDQLVLNGRKFAGYTEFLRTFFAKPNAAMTFRSQKDFFLLLTDHIPLSSVPSEVSKELIHNKTVAVLENVTNFFPAITEVIFAGINPHAGENGLLGTEDIIFSTVIQNLRQLYKNISFAGPFAADGLALGAFDGLHKLFVFSYHDQGLGMFKARNGFNGSNISFGLPFLRLSVDHGTAFDLYGKGSANYFGCLYTMTTAFTAHARLTKT